jgi:hydrogenase nickel incorporation protein HypB
MEIKIMQNIMASNDHAANNLRKELGNMKVLALNIMSSPGSGKTSIIEKTLGLVKEKYRIAVIEGDIETSLDAEKLNKHDIPVVSINTGPFGGDCHLEAGWISQAVSQMDMNAVDILIIENIGNLVCPAEFDTGAHKNIAILSIPEGEDKPLKYPLMFHKADLVLINKCDLIDVLEFDMDALRSNIERVNPNLEVIEISARSGSGLDKWLEWLEKNVSVYDV